jgi:malonate-semialdehyde dehydrogenase (acetylating)/methylmalonate-semialdehyde dehydrogenase
VDLFYEKCNFILNPPSTLTSAFTRLFFFQTDFRNGACLFTQNGRNVRYFRENIEVGMLGVNIGVPAPMDFFPFSGWKNSFYGDLHANGSDCVEFYTRRKMLTARW